jgi:hypothetical protein
MRWKFLRAFSIVALGTTCEDISVIATIWGETCLGTCCSKRARPKKEAVVVERELLYHAHVAA